MLGALFAGEPVPHDRIDGLDFALVEASVPHRSLCALRETGLPVILLTTKDAPEALGADFDGVIGAEEAYGQSGRTQLVTSPEAATRAFASGADLVIYDLPAMISGMLSSLRAGRPAEDPNSDREPFVLLSGMLGNASLWDGIAAHLSDVILPWPARIDLDDSVPEMAASVLAQAPPRFALGGHSLGAIVALEIMRQAPGRVTKLVLVNASARGPTDAQQQVWAQWRQRVLDGAFDQIADELALASLAEPRRADEPLVTANAAMARSVGPEGFLRQLSAQSTRPDSRESAGAIHVPVLVVSGELDEVCPPALQRELAQRCPQAQLVSIENAGHMLPLEAADALAEQLRDWLTLQLLGRRTRRR